MKKLLVIGLLLIVASIPSYAADCASTPGARIDLAGNCELAPYTMGALVATGDSSTTPTTPPVVVQPTPVPVPVPVPGTTKVVTISTSSLLEVFSSGSARTVTGTDSYGHCIGRQQDNLCRAALVFPVDTIPKGTVITKVQLRLVVVYSSALSPYTWAISRYGIVGDDPSKDLPAIAMVRIDGNRYLDTTTTLRTVGTKTILLSKAVSDLTIATIAGKPFAVGIKQNQENVPDKFTALGQTDAQRPQLLVTVKY